MWSPWPVSRASMCCWEVLLDIIFAAHDVVLDDIPRATTGEVPTALGESLATLT